MSGLCSFSVLCRPFMQENNHSFLLNYTAILLQKQRGQRAEKLSRNVMTVTLNSHFTQLVQA